MFGCMHNVSPCWYELGLINEGRGITLSVAGNVEQQFRKAFVPTCPLLRDLQANFPFLTFIPPENQSWGFGEVLRKVEPVREGWHTWQVDWPQLVTCGAESHEVDWHRAYRLSASLFLPLYFLPIADKDPSGQLTQLLECTLSIGREMGHNGLYVGLSPDLHRWVRKHKESHDQPLITKWMQNALKHLYGLTGDLQGYQEIMLYRTRCWINTSTAGIHFECDGNACGLDPDGSPWREDEGYLLGPHNVDSPMQQLTLLTGVAGMHTCARQEGF